jgi:FKBP-type peptidyl-prolyl cis-trans isomerase FkpA
LDRQLFYFLIYSALITYTLSGCGDTAAVEEQALLEEYIQSNRIEAVKNGSFYYRIDSSILDVDSLLIFPTSSNLVETHLKGSLIDETIFADSKNDNGDPLILGLSTNLISGLQIGLLLFPKNSKGTLYLPPSSAYGDAGDIPRNIPGESIIIYEVELLDIFASESAYNDTLIQGYLTDSQMIPDTVISNIQIFIETEGNAVYPNDESKVLMTYSISSLEEELFLEVNDKNAPDTIDLGTAIKGLQLSLPFFGEGGQGSILIPSQLAYGSKGTDTIPNYTPILYKFKLLNIIE